MKNIILFIFCTNCLLLNAQTRVSSFINLSDQGRAYVQNVDGINYVINVAPNEDVRISIINPDGTLKYLYTVHLYDINASSKIAIEDRYIIYYYRFGFQYYDFIGKNGRGITGTSSGIIYPSDIEQVTPEGVIFKGKLSNQTASSYFFIDFNNYYKSLPTEITPIYMYGKNIFASLVNSSGKKEYYLYNPYSGRQEILIDGTTQQCGAYLDDNTGWYLDNDQDVLKINLTTYKRNYAGIRSAYNKNYNQVWTSNGRIMIYQGTPDSAYFEFFDLTSRKKLKELKYNIKGRIENKHFAWNDNTIYFKTTEGVIGVVNIDTEKLISFKTNKDYTFTKWPVVGNTYMLSPFEKSTRLVNIKTGEIYTSQILSSNTIASFPSIISVGSKIYASTIDKYHDKPTVFLLDTINKSIQHTSIFSIFNSGLPTDSDLFTINQQKVLCADDVFSFTNTQTTQINGDPLLPVRISKYIISDGNIYYAKLKNNNLYFYWYDGNTETLIASIPEKDNELYQFNVTKKYVYIVNKKFKFYRIDRETNNIQPLPQFENSYLIFSNIVHQNTYFIRTQYYLVKATDDGSFEYLSYLPTIDFAYVYEYNNRLFIQFINQLYIYTDGEFKPMYGQDIININASPIPQNSAQLISTVSDKEWGIAEGDSIYFIPSPKIAKIVLKKIQTGQNFAIFQDPDKLFLLLDYAKKRYVRLPDEIDKKNIISVYILKSDTLAIEQANNALNTYRLSGYFTTAELISTLPTATTHIDANVTINNDFGLLTTSSANFFIGDAGKLQLIEKIYPGATDNNTTLKDGDNIYFFGIGIEWGRQLYTLKKSDFDTNVTHNETIQQAIVLYPNPTNDNVFISGLENQTYSGAIFDGQGRQIQSYVSSSSMIETGDLMPGIYYLKLKINDTIKVLSFIKI
jgi:hypothetical protein